MKNARLPLKRENKDRQEEKTESGVISSLPRPSALIRVSSAKPSGVSECMEAISTPCGSSRVPLIRSRTLIHCDWKRSGRSHGPPHASRDSRHRGGNLRPLPGTPPAGGNVNGRGPS